MNFNLVDTLIVLALGIGTFIGFSMIGAGNAKPNQAERPLYGTDNHTTSLFGNVLFPHQVMPAALQVIAYILLQYYFFTNIRLILKGWIIPMILALQCAIIVPLGYGVYCLMPKKGEKKTLSGC